MPKISVIVPVYRVEKYIHRCVDSILNQTFTDFELILVDDGSPDDCGAICDEYAAKDSRIVVIHQENGGLSAARNAGIDWAFANSDSEWLTFIDSDDWIHPQYLESLLKAVVEHDVKVSVCAYAETEGEDPEFDDPITWERWIPEEFYVEHNVNAIIACAKLYKKECFTGLRYPVGKIHEDEYLTHELLFQDSYIAVISRPLYYYFKNPQGISKTSWNPKRLDALDAFWNQMAFFKTHKYRKAYDHRAKGSALYACRAMESIDGESSLDVKTKKMLKKKVRRFLRKLLFLNQGVPEHKRAHKEWILLNAFPLPMHIYFAVCKIYNRIVNGKRG